MSYQPLTPDDVSFDKLTELQRRLLAATKADRITWESHRSYFEWSSPKGVVEVAPEGITVYDDRGVRHRQFEPPTDDLHALIVEKHEARVIATIERILADLDAMAAEGVSA